MLRFLCCLLLLAGACPVQAQNKPRTCLWQVRKPGVHHTSYLFGTFHEVNGPYFSSLTASAQRLAQADLLLIECRREELEQEEKNRQGYATWNVPKWQALLTDPQRATFAQFVAKAEDSSYYQVAPLLLRLGLFKLYEQNFCDTLGRTSGEPLDLYIERLALARHTPVRSLDTREDRRKALLLADDRAQAAHVAPCIELMQAMLQNDHSKCGSGQEYRTMEMDYKFAQAGRNELGRLDRNAKWLPILDQAFRKKSCFVAVGFGHLMYQQGLIQQLRRQGYVVTPVAAR